MGQRKANVKKILAGEERIFKVYFRNPLGIEYPLESLKQCGDMQSLEYKDDKGNKVVLSHPHTPLDLYIEGRKIETYATGDIALELKKFKVRVEEAEIKALWRLKLVMEDIGFLNKLFNTGVTVGIYGIEQKFTEGIFTEDLYSTLSEAAEELFVDEANRMKEFLRSSVPRRG